MAVKSRPRGEQAFWDDFAQRLLDPFSETVRKVLVRMLFNYPLRRLPPELARLAKPLRAAKQAQKRKR
jgi:hypothetical protein